MVIEVWKDIPGFEGWYQVSDQGQVRSLDRYVNAKLGAKKLVRGQILIHGFDTDLYWKVGLWRNGEVETWKVHSLVLLAFVGPMPDGLQTRHLNGNKDHNHLGNLKYGTVLENSEDRTQHGTQVSGETHGRHKISDLEAWAIKFATGMFTQKVLGEMFGVKQAQVSSIQRGDSRGYL